MAEETNEVASDVSRSTLGMSPERKALFEQFITTTCERLGPGSEFPQGVLDSMAFVFNGLPLETASPSRVIQMVKPIASVPEAGAKRKKSTYDTFKTVVMKHLNGIVETHDRMSYASMLWSQVVKPNGTLVKEWDSFVQNGGERPALPGKDDPIWATYGEELKALRAKKASAPKAPVAQ
jgi:hypothetical protein